MSEDFAMRRGARSLQRHSGAMAAAVPDAFSHAPASLTLLHKPDTAPTTVAQWTLPVRQWAWRQADPSPTAAKADTGIADPMLRRRLSPLARLALTAAAACGPLPAGVRLVYASPHGEILRTTQMLEALTRDEPPSPTAFSLSVLNATPGVLSMARDDMAPVNALSSGDDTLGYALLDAWTQWQETPDVPVLLIYAFEAPPACYGETARQSNDTATALALLIDADARARLTCRMARAPQQTRERNAVAQHESLVQTLTAGGHGDWTGASHLWTWEWHDAQA